MAQCPFAGALLADLGADVVRIDRPPRAGPNPKPPRFDFYNRNKRSLALDLKTTWRRANALLAMVERADALIEGWRPGVAERLGLGPAECLARNPKLVYGRMTGWGQEGPLAQEAGHDINYLALTGALHCIGGPGRPPAPPLNLVADLGGGAMYLAVGVLAALLEAKTSGRGQVVDAAMVDGVSCLMSAFQAFRQQGEWTANRGENIVDGGAPLRRLRDRRTASTVAVGAIEPHFYANLLARDGAGRRHAAGAERPRRLPMRERFRRRLPHPRAPGGPAMAGRECCFAPVLDIDEAWATRTCARAARTRFDGLWHPPAPRFSPRRARCGDQAPAAGRPVRGNPRRLGIPKGTLA